MLLKQGCWAKSQRELRVENKASQDSDDPLPGVAQACGLKFFPGDAAASPPLTPG